MGWMFSGPMGRGGWSLQPALFQRQYGWTGDAGSQSWQAPRLRPGRILRVQWGLGLGGSKFGLSKPDRHHQLVYDHDLNSYQRVHLGTNPTSGSKIRGGWCNTRRFRAME